MNDSCLVQFQKVLCFFLHYHLGLSALPLKKPCRLNILRKQFKFIADCLLFDPGFRFDWLRFERESCRFPDIPNKLWWRLMTWIKLNINGCFLGINSLINCLSWLQLIFCLNETVFTVPSVVLKIKLIIITLKHKE